MSIMQFFKNLSGNASLKKLSPRSILSLLVSALIAFLLLVAVFNVATKYFGIRSNIKKLEAQKSELQTKKDNLEDINKRLETAEGIEETLRDKYNVVKPGEGMIIVTNKDESMDNKSGKNAVSRWWNDILLGIGIRKE
jgi:cell division protein FtsB